MLGRPEKAQQSPEQATETENGCVPVHSYSTHVQLWPARSDSWHGLQAFVAPVQPQTSWSFETGHITVFPVGVVQLRPGKLLQLANGWLPVVIRVTSCCPPPPADAPGEPRAPLTNVG